MTGHTERRGHLLLAVLVGLLVLALTPASSWAFGRDYEGYHGWIDRLTNEVKIAQANAAGTDAAFDPYVGQLMVVKAALKRGDQAAVYKGVNGFMDMLEKREHGISDADATRLFDYCFEVTPAKFHDISRHTATYEPLRWWDEMVYHSE